MYVSSSSSSSTNIMSPSTGCAPATHRSSSSQYGSLTRSWKAWLPLDHGRGSLWWSTGRFTDASSQTHTHTLFSCLSSLLTLQHWTPGTRRTGQSSPVAASLRSAGGAGGTQMMSTWSHPSPKPVRWMLEPRGPVERQPADNVGKLPTPQIVTLVKLSIDSCLCQMSGYGADCLWKCPNNSEWRKLFASLYNYSLCCL